MAQYDAFADAFEAHAAQSAYNAHYDRPSVLRLLGPVDGLHVLDAGCGPGLYAAELVRRGATVTGVDASPRLVELARARLGESAEVRVHDLDDPLPFGDGSFDAVVMALVLHHLADPGPALTELYRVLRPGGHAVVSTVHPTADWLRLGGSYFVDEMVDETWNAGWQVSFRRAPLEAVVADFADAGFLVERIVETRPDAAMEEHHPALAERLSNEPGFIVFRLVRP